MLSWETLWDAMCFGTGRVTKRTLIWVDTNVDGCHDSSYVPRMPELPVDLKGFSQETQNRIMACRHMIFVMQNKKSCASDSETEDRQQDADEDTD